jgi:hypothetical protein
MQHLSGQDATFLYLETPGAHLNLTGLYIYQQPGGKNGRLGFAEISQLISAALEDVSELSRKMLRPPLDIDYPIWVEDPEFDLKQHVIRYPGRAPRSRQALFKILSEIHAEAMDLSRAPWEMHVLERLDRIPGLPPHCFAIVMKYHHAAIDGASGAVLVDRLHGIHSAEPLTREQSRPPGTAETLLRAALSNAGSTVALVRAIADAAPTELRRWRDGWFAAKKEKVAVPDTRFNRPVSAQRIMHASSFELSRLRAISQACKKAAQVDKDKESPGAGTHTGRGPTINDVLLAVCGGALRRWLMRRDELPTEPLVAMVPVNTRSEGEDQLPGNHISTLFLPIGTDIENPLQRLWAITAATGRAKTGEDGMDPRKLNAIASNIPALPLSLAAHLTTGLGLAYRGLRLCNCTITSVPPNQEGLHLGPAPLVNIVANGPLLDGMGLIISIISYAGITNLSFTSCPEMLPDPAELARDAERELASLEKELRKQADSGLTSS